MHLHWSWLAVLLLAEGSLEPAAQTYTIKIKVFPDAGTTVTIQDTDKMSGSSRAIDTDGKLFQENKTTKNKELAYSLTTLQRKNGDARADKYMQVYEKATETRDGKTRALSYQGRTIVFERKGNVYLVGAVGKQPLDEADLDELIKKANEPLTEVKEIQAIIPERPVAVGERWTLDPAKLANLLKDIDLDAKLSRGEARLVKVYTKGKNLFGVIEMRLTLRVKRFDETVTFSPPASMEAKVTIETAIDGSSTARTDTMSLTIKGKGLLVVGPKKQTWEIDQHMSGRKVCSEEKDDARVREVPAVNLVGPDRHWAEFRSKEGRFTATFPGKPVVSKQKTDNSVTTIFTVERDKGRLAYIAGFTDYKDAKADADPKAVLQAVTDSVAKNSKKKPKDIKLNGFNGVELVHEMEQAGMKMTITHRAYFVKGRLYQLIIVQAAGATERVQAKKFFDSCKLDEKK